MNNRKMKPLAAAIGTAFAMSLTAGAVADEANPFEAQVVEDGTLLADGHKEGGCGEDGKCGEKDKGDDEAHCGEDDGHEPHGDGDEDSGDEEEDAEEEG